MRRRSMVGLWAFLGLAAAATAGPPRVEDPGLEIALFAAEPDIVTPVGVAVDPKGRVLVVESQTHFRPADYQGPPADRIRTFEDRDGDGKAENVGTFFEGSKYTMGLAFHPDGTLLVATRWEVFRLRDADGDGKADGPPEPLAKLETDGDYPHNGLSGFAFDAEGRVYFGLGENLGASYRLVGKDGKTLSGGGEGGNVYRMGGDGSGLERVATGFWNPFHLAFDPFGRLFAVDNDPDSRPPCRLIHVVPNGDYGYRFRNGRKGLHPFTAWNGELPGTLPMAAGTGEAPSAVVAYESDQLGTLRGALLVTSWGDHRIDAFRARPTTEGASLSFDRRPIVTGGEDFRPVGMAVGTDGSIYVTDWVDRSYALHGKGRVWRIKSARPFARVAPKDDAEALRHPDRATREAAARRLAKTDRDAVRDAAGSADERTAASALDALITTSEPDDGPTFRKALTHASPAVRALAVRRLPVELVNAKEVGAADDSPEVRAERLRRVASVAAAPVLYKALASPDPFIRQAAREGLRRSIPERDLIGLNRHDDAAVRLGALLALRESNVNLSTAQDVVSVALGDRDPDVRFVGIQWAAEGKVPASERRLNWSLYRPDLELTPREFVAVLAALDALARPARGPKDEAPGEEFVADLVARGGPRLHQALRLLRPDHPALTGRLIEELVLHPDPRVQVEALRTLRERKPADRFALLERALRDEGSSRPVRLEALVGLSEADMTDDARRGALVDLATGPDLLIRREALRSLRGAPLTVKESARLEKAARHGDPATAEMIDALSGFDQTRLDAPRPLAEWVERLKGAADSDAGGRLFFHPKGPGCYRCHQVDGRGGKVGPDLSATGKAVTRERLIESIIDPGKEVAPQFTTWALALRDGRVVTGTLLGETLEGTVYGDAEGRLVTVKPADVEEARPLKDSIMPADLHRLMTEHEFRDLLAYLTRPF